MTRNCVDAIIARAATRKAMRSSFNAQDRFGLNRLVPYLLCVAIAVAGVQPLFYGYVPLGADTALHYFRIAEVHRLWSEGIFFTQWMPDLAFGYGYPLGNYHPPLAYYLASIMRMLGLSLPHAMVASWVLSSLCAAIGMFAWVRRISKSEAGAIVAVLAYAFAPYTLYNIFTRGGFAESIAMSITPWVLYAIHRATEERGNAFGLLVSLFFAAITLTHVIAGLLFAPIVGGYILICAYTAKRKAGAYATVAQIVKLAACVALGAGLSAVFWLPPQFELGLIQISRGTAGYASFEDHFLSLSNVLALPNQVDPNLVGQFVPSSLNWIAVVLGASAVIGLWTNRLRGVATNTLFLMVVALIATFMTLEASLPVWDIVRVLRFLQYPFRFLGVASLALAALAGFGFAALISRQTKTQNAALQSYAIGACVLALSVYAYTWQITKPDPLANNAAVGIADIWQAERKLGTIGTTSFGEYLPVGVQDMPVSPAYDNASQPERFDFTGVPESIIVSSAVYKPLRYDIALETPQAFTATFRSFYFPGWKGYIDNQVVELSASTPHGLIQLPVPAGKHLITIQFETTPIRQLAAQISGAALALFLTLAGVMLVRSRQKPTELRLSRAEDPIAKLPRMSAAFAAIAIISTITFKTAIVDTRSTIFSSTRFTDGALSNADLYPDLNYDNKLKLVGVDLEQQDAIAGETFEYTQYWSLPQPTDEDYSIKSVLQSNEGVVYGQYETQHPSGLFPTSRFTTTDYIADHRKIIVAPFTPPGEYIIKTIVYRYGKPSERLMPLTDKNAPAGTTFLATEARTFTITIGLGKSPANGIVLPEHQAINREVDNNIIYVGHIFPATLDMRPGSNFSVDTFWQAVGTPQQDSEICFELQNGVDSIRLRCDAPVPALPTSKWRSGDVWRIAHGMRLPRTLKTGVYTLVVVGENKQAVPISTLSVTAPTRITSLPPGIVNEPHLFANSVRITGYEAPESIASGAVLSVTVYWATDAEIDLQLKSFVHLIDASNNRVAGSDQYPGANRSTTDWIRGEYVADQHIIQLPDDLKPGTYRLLVGLYDEYNLSRILLQTGETAALLSAPITVK